MSGFMVDMSVCMVPMVIVHVHINPEREHLATSKGCLPGSGHHSKTAHGDKRERAVFSGQQVYCNYGTSCFASIIITKMGFAKKMAILLKK